MEDEAMPSASGGGAALPPVLPLAPAGSMELVALPIGVHGTVGAPNAASEGRAGGTAGVMPPDQGSFAEASPQGCQPASHPPPGAEIYVWGRNDAGQLGLGEGSAEEVPAPERVAALQGRALAGAAAGALHTAVVTGDGELYVAGSNEGGQLGVRGLAQAASLSRVAALEHSRVALACCGGAHTLAVSEDGSVAAWGSSEFGQLGLGPVAATQVPLPKPIKSLRSAGVRIARASAGDKHSLLLSSGAALYACGDNSAGALGLAGAEGADTPQLVLPLWPLGVVQVSCGGSHSAALTVDGQLFTWGRNRHGQLGLSDFEGRAAPSRVRAIAGASQVACGGDHTVALAAGELLAWGQGSWGQTGLGHTSNAAAPQKVPGLHGQAITQISAGSRHTLALSRSNEVWGFGCNDAGQLGCPAGGSRLVASRVEGLPTGGVGAMPLFVVAGGDHGAAVVRRGADIGGEAGGRFPGEHLCPMSVPSLPALLQTASTGDTAGRAALLPAIDAVFSSPAFLVQAMQPHQEGTSRISSSPLSLLEQIDPQVIGDTYQALLTLYDPEVAAALGAACLRLLDTLEKYVALPNLPSLGPLDWVPAVLFSLLVNPLNADPGGYGGQIILRISRILAVALPMELRPPAREALERLLKRMPAEAFAARCVRPAQRYLSSIVLSGRLGAARLEVMMVGVLLDVMRQANDDAGGIIPYTEFYNEALSSAVDLEAEYVAWTRHAACNPRALVSLLQMPYLLSAEAKARVLRGEALMQQQRNVSASAAAALTQGLHPAGLAFLHIAVRRGHVVEDALNQIGQRSLEELKKPLRVTFVTNGVPEPAQDAGGPAKEFFQLLSRDLFRPEFGMFAHCEEARTVWFSADSLEGEGEFALVGAMLGLAIYNGVLLDVHLPSIVYKTLLGGTPELKDLHGVDPALARGLASLLEFEGDVEGTYCRSFVAERASFGEVVRHELVLGGEGIPVTADNRRDYVDKLVAWLLRGSVQRQLEAFAAGFKKVCGGPALSMLRPEELELMVVGQRQLDFQQLEAAARYEGGFHRDHPVVRWLWEVVQSLPLDQKRAFLAFTTGSDRAPIGGLSKLPLLIQRAGPDSTALPTSHTCFNALLLPEYSSECKVRERLLMAVENAQGFGLR